MEFLLLWWDDLDDLTHAARHLASAALSELTISAPVATGISATCAWVLLRLHA